MISDFFIRILKNPSGIFSVETLANVIGEGLQNQTRFAFDLGGASLHRRNH